MIQNVNKYPIDEILKKDASFHYVIPKYQREYTWSYKEWDALYDDITENLEGYFIGSIICINTGVHCHPKLSPKFTVFFTSSLQTSNACPAFLFMTTRILSDGFAAAD